ncbi:hypothetical protein HN512_04065 [Candidatus Peregrinibacteria bacterium]|jgi:hypothetical protein|nr:hypothetical protein [Candidatus Peregrinibacteria bacterium]MBT3598985.1 hypothetical protein [Candidatus Peregrinibacteria bacterium]MBT4366983.1 hypothetical protein [Candidatus Peregrinibacteria bacterium]MBT4585489.1 hypothetical protein [Candidatus Peregrinibacteria bacterium]MBT6731304.1 hypothetical protein [Candidatus Peregrinibacteria bacterium]
MNEFPEPKACPLIIAKDGCRSKCAADYKDLPSGNEPCIGISSLSSRVGLKFGPEFIECPKYSRAFYGITDEMLKEVGKGKSVRELIKEVLEENES